MSDSWGVKCNVAEPRKTARSGALCWVTLTNPGWGGERIEVLERSRGGRQIVIWESRKHLANFRAAWIPEHLRAGKYRVMWWDKREEAQAWADAMNQAVTG